MTTPATPAPPVNGHGNAGPTPEQQLEAMAYAGYRALAQQLGAINVLLSAMPLSALLTACRRHQTTSVLTAPAGVPPEQVQALVASLRGDEKVITAALNLQRVVHAVANGG